MDKTYNCYEFLKWKLYKELKPSHSRVIKLKFVKLGVNQLQLRIEMV